MMINNQFWNGVDIMLCKKTIDAVREAYRVSLTMSRTLNEVTKNYARQLEQIKPANSSEARILGEIISETNLAYNERQKTLGITNCVESLIFLAQHIVLWYNETHKSKIYASFSFRRKALESELKKIVSRVLNGKISTIKDRFACRCIICNNDDPTNIEAEIKSISQMYTLTNLLLDIFSGFNLETIRAFSEWVEKKYAKDKEIRIKLLKSLSTNFILCQAETPINTGFDASKHPEIYVPEKSGILDFYCERFVKGYTANPKCTGYQSEHFVISISPNSDFFPGLYIEFQIRTQCMHDRAEDSSSPQSHKNHKVSVTSISTETANFNVDELFEIEDWSDIHIVGVSKMSDFAGLREPVCSFIRNILS